MTKGINGFQPGRLTQVLAARRLSQIQLAMMVGVSPSTISKWRSGQQAPDGETLAQLAAVVNVSAEWFTRNPSASCSEPLFRSNASAHVAARDMLKTRWIWAEDIAIGMLEFVDLPNLNLPTRDFKSPDEISDLEIEVAAAECRDLWNLGRGAISDVALAVESAGIILVREQTGIAQIEGLSAWSEPLSRPIILLSSDKDNAYRSRFDLAHELGHLILHKNIDRVTERERHALMERQAHKFAGAFLLPAESFAPEIKSRVSLGSLLLLKERWGVSVAAIIMRLEALGIIDAYEKLSLFKARTTRWGAKSEPNDDDREPENPRLLKRTFELLVTSGVITHTSIGKYIGLQARDIESLIGLPPYYLDGQAEVIELARLKTTVREMSTEQSSGANVVPFPKFVAKKA